MSLLVNMNLYLDDMILDISRNSKTYTLDKMLNCSINIRYIGLGTPSPTPHPYLLKQRIMLSINLNKK